MPSDYSSSFFFVANTPTPDNRAAIAGRTVPNVDVPVLGSSFCDEPVEAFVVEDWAVVWLSAVLSPLLSIVDNLAFNSSIRFTIASTSAWVAFGLLNTSLASASKVWVSFLDSSLNLYANLKTNSSNCKIS